MRVPALLLGSLLATLGLPLASAAGLAGGDAVAGASALFYICVDEPPYPGAPDYSGDFCVDGQLFPECLVVHHWQDSQGGGERCYVPFPGDADAKALAG